MTENFHKTETYNVDRSTFGGTIYSSDFETEYRGKSNTTGSNIANRIISDWNFDKYCAKNLEIRYRKKAYSNG